MGVEQTKLTAFIYLLLIIFSGSTDGFDSERIRSGISGTESGHARSTPPPESPECKEDIINDQGFREILENSARSKHMLPSRSGVTVEIEMQVQTVSTLSETQAEFEIDILYSQLWTDTKLSFAGMNSCKRNITLSPDFLAKIWSPNICLVNTKSASVHVSPTENIFVILYDDGKLWVNYRLKATGPCDLDLRLFPFDTQSCSLAFESYSYNAAEVSLAWLDNPIGFLPNAIQLPDFDLVRNNTLHEELAYPNGQWDRLTANFTFQRRFGFYIFQAYVPTFIIIASSWIGFCMDAKALPARTTVGVSSLLALTFQFGNIIKNLPKVSYVKAMDIWMLVSVSFVFGTLMELAIICWLNKNSNEQMRKRTRRMRSSQGSDPFSQNSARSRQFLIPMSPQPDHQFGMSMKSQGDDFSLQESPIISPIAKTTCHCESEGKQLTRRGSLEVPHFYCAQFMSSNGGLPPSVPYLTGLGTAGHCNPPIRASKPAGRFTRRLSNTTGKILRSRKTWRIFGKKWKPACTPEFIDHFSTIFFPFCFLIFNSVYWGYYIQKIKAPQ